MKKRLKIFLSIMLLLSLAISLYPLRIHATEESLNEERINKNNLSLKTIKDKNPNAYRKIDIFYKGNKLSTNGRLINGITYVPLRFFINEVSPEMQVSYYSKSRTLAVTGDGFSMTVCDFSYTANANGRILFNSSPSVIMNDNRIYVPISIAAKALSLKLKPLGTKIEISGQLSPILSSDKFYREDEVYWLSRIISAESRGEGLLGQIAVGNVVLNRVKSNLYPNTIWGVIFDKKYGVQFSPVLDGSIYNVPTESSITAAKIALEGYRVSENALFFLAPRYAESSWIPNTRTYEFTIGAHDFYS